MKYAVGIWTADPNGVKRDPLTIPGTYRINEKYGYHTTNIQAKRAYVNAHWLGSESVSDKNIKYYWDRNNSFRKTAKIIKIHN
jgi:hypothetical protein